MTTGSFTQNRQTDFTTDFGTTWKGSYWSRTWNGGDRPADDVVVPPTFVSPVKDFSKRGIAILDKQILANNRNAIARYKDAIRASQLRKLRSRIVEGNKPHDYTTARTFMSQDMDLVKFPGNARLYSATPTQAFGNVLNNGMFPQRWTSDNDVYLINKLKTKLMGSSFNAGVFIAELYPALTMITNAASRLYRSRKALIRGDLAGAWRALSPMGSTFAPKVRRGEPIASQWLEMSYGWLPLVSDLEDAAVMIAHNDITNTPFYRAKTRFKIGGSGAGSWKDGPVNAFNGKAFGYRVESGQLIAYLREVNVPQLVGLTNVASVAWEVLPFSFVADWAIPVGKYLDARGVAQALKGEFVTTRNSKIHVSDFRYTGCTIMTTPKAGFTNWAVTMTRTVSSTLTVPLPEVKPYNEVLNWKRAANAVALLITTGSLPKGVRG